MTGGAGWHVGVTASRTNRPKPQLECAGRLFDWLWRNGYSDWHGGDCAGGDTQMYWQATRYFWLHGHPMDGTRWRSFLNYHDLRPVKPPLDRNKDIVDESHYLVALPDGYSERVRSGTWSTIRYAFRTNKPGCVIFPDGSVKTLTGALEPNGST